MTHPEGTSGPEERAGSPPGPGDRRDAAGGHGGLPQTGVSRALDAFIRGVGNLVSWVWLLLVAVIVLNVTMRYVFGEGRIEFEEIQWHIYSVGFLIGLSYCLEADSHVRVDLLYERFRPTTKAWVELLGIVLFLIPFMVLVFVYAVPFVSYSLSTNEISEAPGGLPFRWLIKVMLPVGIALLAVATLSRLTRVTALLFGVPKPRHTVK